MYKDKDKQREAIKNARGLSVVDELSDTHPVILKDTPIVIPCEIPNGDTDINVVKALHRVINNSKRGKDLKCITIGDQARSMLTMAMLHSVTGKPGDADYNGICTDEWRAERGR